MAVSTVAVLGLTAACSGSGGGSGGDGKDEKPGRADATSATAKLEKAALASGDVKKYKVAKESGEANQGKGAPQAGRVNPAECRPLSEMLTAAAPPKSKAHVSRTLSSTDVAETTTTEVVLLAYGQADAENTMDTLRTATKSKKCATFGDGGHRYIGVRPQPAPVGGDEAVSYKLASRAGEFLDRDRVTVVRSGSTLIAFRASNVFDPESAKSDEEGEAAGLPEKFRDGVTADPKVADAIVDAQLAKLAEAGKR
ncbi:hypothetical protein M4V62_17965 [Streptomyces durmitorensis]|uniref:Lipoprotein n=1 Tax=Streptomyces durmitorensis TaxID=319947 RepID=A0ABY4PV49_9ACTN|nr:hypothetical protein [Streptomyces durmitorensis]UQT56829.1 hypothetical protein M4V62_17965 [Streptomyces durmitorensis]